ncbi:aquaporin [Candidatus Gottesmanbacteria bacterium]|nr:aquaporin [Candidatus Gottesmanbacteria bacterium]
MNKYLIELVGTFLLTTVISFSGVPLAVGAILIGLVYMGGAISGGHYNPAVTFAVWVRGAISFTDMQMYMLFQLVGGLTASLLYAIVHEQFFIVSPKASFVPSFIMELVGAGALAFVVLHVATSKHTKGNQYFGLAIGTTLLAFGYAGADISGSVYNPAVALGSILFNIITIGTVLPSAILYTVAPLVGGLAAGKLFLLTTKE